MIPVLSPPRHTGSLLAGIQRRKLNQIFTRFSLVCDIGIKPSKKRGFRLKQCRNDEAPQALTPSYRQSFSRYPEKKTEQGLHELQFNMQYRHKTK